VLDPVERRGRSGGRWLGSEALGRKGGQRCRAFRVDGIASLTAEAMELGTTLQRLSAF